MAAASAANELRKPETQAKLRAVAEPIVRDAARSIGEQHPARAAGYLAQSLLHRLRKD